MPAITLPDGSVRDYPGPVTGTEIAASIGPGLAKAALAMEVAALKSPADADRLKAKLALLGMDVAVQKIDNAGAALYRVRVGPFKTESTAMGAMDTLAANQFEPRMIKEAANQR